MPAPFDTSELLNKDGGHLRYEQIAKAIAAAIEKGTLSPGDRLPTVRKLAADLKVSMTTVNAAFSILAERGLIRGEVGRGTFVADRAAPKAVQLPRFVGGLLRRSSKVPWRRRALVTQGARLRAAYPNAVDCSTGRPDPALLPLELIRRHWSRSMDGVGSADLQYAGPEPIQELAIQTVRRLSMDAIPARAADLVVGSSAQQFMVLTLEIVAGLWGPEHTLIAVEQPGYPTIMDTWERAGARLIGMSVDEDGVVPESLATALKAGAKAVLFTPRAHNPTGASWSERRVSALADVLHEFRDVIAIEDDQFGGISNRRSGSLLGDSRIEDQVLYIRSFSKTIAPDLRVAVAAARPRLRSLLLDAKSHADGWTSRLVQRVLACIFQDPELDAYLDRARDEYRLRRESAATVINAALSSGAGTWSGCEGVNLWVHLPSGVDVAETIERAAIGGVLVASGEPFYISPGHSEVLRFNAGSVGSDRVVLCAKELVDAVLASEGRTADPIHV